MAQRAQRLAPKSRDFLIQRYLLVVDNELLLDEHFLVFRTVHHDLGVTLFEDRRSNHLLVANRRHTLNNDLFRNLGRLHVSEGVLRFEIGFITLERARAAD